MATSPYWNLDSFYQGADPDPQTLALIKKYDPTATLNPTSENSEGNARGGGFNYDVSKLPKSSVGDFQQMTAGYTQAYDPYGKIRSDVIDSGKIIKDPVYGYITPRQNIKDAKPGLIDILGPMAVMGAASFANPGVFANMGFGEKAAIAIPKLAQGGLNLNSILNTGLSFLPGNYGSLAKLGLTGYNMLSGGSGNNVSGNSGVSPTIPGSTGSLSTNGQVGRSSTSPVSTRNPILDQISQSTSAQRIESPYVSNRQEMATPAGKLANTPYLLPFKQS